MSQNQEVATATQSAANAENGAHSRADAWARALAATKAARAALDEATIADDKEAKARALNGMDAVAMTNLEAVIADLEALTSFYRNTENVEFDLTPEERRRLTSARVRNNGFIDKCFDLALSNPQFIPPYLSPATILTVMRRYEDSRQIMVVAQQFMRLATDRFMLEANVAYHVALRFYGYLREQARVSISGAKDLFEQLLNFFKHRRRASSSAEADLTEKELEADFKKIVHGKADGEVYVENEMPHTTGGGRRIVDSVHTGHEAVEAEGEVIKKE